MLTRKDFKAVAEIIAQRKPSFTTSREDIGKMTACRYLAIDLADYFAAQNPRFDRSRFMQACGLN